MKISKLWNKYIEFIAKPLIILFILLFILFGIIFHVTFFNLGWHNLDLGQNIKYLECEFGTTIKDYTSQGTLLTGLELYNTGFNMMYTAFYKGMYFCFVFGFGLCYLIMKNGKVIK